VDAPRTAGKAGGRGAALFINIEGRECVLRHYFRGGLPGRFIADQFVWAGSTRTRSVREWDLLFAMRDLGLPVPAPIAARYVHHGLYYTADLITERLAGVRTFSSLLSDGEASDTVWRNVGECIARLHFAGFFHADLNAHNLQIDENNKVWLLDWDRGDRKQPGSWRNSNLARLHRSLNKISNVQGAYFSDSNWKLLSQAYFDLWERLPD
jgi:3-deoxy-D-manno-octulosonic acid kinase